MDELRVAGLVNDSIVDGPGIRFAIFTQGCVHNCKGCHNPETHDINGGHIEKMDDILAKIKRNVLLDGVTFTGGDPFLQAKSLVKLAKEIKKLNLNIMTYTGYTWEELVDGFDKNEGWKELVELTDILVDGRFHENERSIELKWKGSKNQRVIDVKKTLENNEVTLYE